MPEKIYSQFARLSIRAPVNNLPVNQLDPGKLGRAVDICSVTSQTFYSCSLRSWHCSCK